MDSKRQAPPESDAPQLSETELEHVAGGVAEAVSYKVKYEDIKLDVKWEGPDFDAAFKLKK